MAVIGGESMDAYSLDVILKLGVSVLGVVISIFMKGILDAIKETKESIVSLNVKIATVVEKTSNHDKLFDDHKEVIRAHEDRIRELETSKA